MLRVLFVLLLCLGCVTRGPTKPLVNEATVTVAGAELEVVFDGEFDLTRDELLAWVEACAKAVATYYGEFPVERARLEIRSRRGAAGVRGGRAFGWDPPLIQVGVGSASELEHLERDWVLTHEMVHLAMPTVERKHHWLEEGLSTYVEPLARHQVGNLTAERVWYWNVTGLPQGLPKKGDQGLDHTPTWGRTYWGGALFYFLADIKIREETSNEKSLQDALRGVVDAGGTMSAHWEIEKILETGDAATGTKVLQTLYGEMKAAPHPVDLPKIFERLGVSYDGEVVTFDDEAPDSPIRRAIAN